MHRGRICLDGAEIASRCSAARLEGGISPGSEYSPKTCNHLEVKPSDSRGGASGLTEAAQQPHRGGLSYDAHPLSHVGEQQSQQPNAMFALKLFNPCAALDRDLL